MSRRFGRQSQRKYRWVGLTPEPFTLVPNSANAVPLLTPILPPATVADGVYQSMTTPTIIAVQGHVTIVIPNPVSAGNYANCAWGLYLDEDATSLATTTTPFSQSGTTRWMMWHACCIFDQSLGTNPATDAAYRRYEFSQRKYKRKADSGNDSFLFVAENAASPLSTSDIQVHSYFRILLLE